MHAVFGNPGMPDANTSSCPYCSLSGIRVGGRGKKAGLAPPKSSPAAETVGRDESADKGISQGKDESRVGWSVGSRWSASYRVSPCATATRVHGGGCIEPAQRSDGDR